ncbi:MAG: hypothetical protein C0390_00640 [Syntrophus sp. (in: bacteria)]|nr:hypothetical protein [Syntrophus sp. (in: bacteria)]
MGCYFNESEISLACRTFAQAETMAGQYFRFNAREWKAHRYDVKTLAYLDQHEVRKGAFAHLCKYEFEKEPEPEGRGLHFYRICLQDDRILDAVERANSFIRLSPLLLYIAAHELVHVIRFDRGEVNFDSPEEEKSEEEETVHRITRNLLKPMTDPDLNLVLDCFSNRYQIGDLLQ